MSRFPIVLGLWPMTAKRPPAPGLAGWRKAAGWQGTGARAPSGHRRPDPTLGAVATALLDSG
ncbi:hypothetical protein [Novispirillum itersonii]|uniref:hypothetical protein n=1 Tax=Novispirillum itersonii TaxID=189 RepID=UPI0012DC0ABF|nr:hypothetical protein [Novispirillum itersonii]